jgi:hypothetical protein
MSNMDDARSTSSPRVVYQQSLELERRIGDDWASMRKQVISARQLEAAYGAVQNEISALDLRLSPEAAQQVVDLYNKAVLDGRYLKDLTIDPRSVAQALDLSLSAEGEAGLKRLGELGAIRTAREEALVPLVGVVAIVGIVVLGVVLVVDPAVRDEVVIDSSGVVKL